ncbi:MAG: hypothetical protein ONB23_12545 [candidate division KSB1 bacterium]|nr:hypothetical protein [candidate division KSB1 bacterium]
MAKATRGWLLALALWPGLLKAGLPGPDVGPNAHDWRGRLKRASLYLELGGEGLGLSANFDYRIMRNLALRVGVSRVYLGAAFPFSLSYLSDGDSSGHLELGMGVTYCLYYSYSAMLFSLVSPTTSAELIEGVQVLTVVLGYRRQRRDGGLMWRLSLTPLFVRRKETQEANSRSRYEYRAFAGVSLGFCF